MKTHRHIQLNILIDNLESIARVSMSAGVNALRIGNFNAANHFFKKSNKASMSCETARRLIFSLRPKRVDPENKKPRPFCSKECVWRINANFNLQRNALRVETLVDQNRCGWNIKKGCIGGSPLDYAPCLF